MNKYRVIIMQVDRLFGDCYYYAECVEAGSEAEAFEKGKQTETFRRDDTSVINRIELIRKEFHVK